MRGIDIPIVFALSLLPIVWLRLGHAGPFSIELFHLGGIVLILCTFLAVSRVGSIVEVIKHNRLWLIFFAFYLMIYFLAMLWHGTPRGINPLVRQFFFLIVAICFASRIQYYKFVPSTLYVAAVIGLFGFLLMFWMSAQRVNLSLAAEAMNVVTTGNVDRFLYRFIRPTLNAFSASKALEFGASKRNEISAALLVIWLFIKIGGSWMVKSWWMRGFDICLSVICLGLILIFMTRSVILSMIVVLAGVGIHRLLSRRATWRSVLVAMVAGLVVSLVLIKGEAITDLLFQRFVEDTQSYKFRLSVYNFAIEQIEAGLWFGSGFLPQKSGIRVHNIFLAAWAQAGIFAFWCALSFWLLLSVRALRVMFSRAATQSQWRLPVGPEWVAALMVMPLFRVLLSGDSGNLNLPEWISIGGFMGLLLLNERSAETPRASNEAGGEVRGVPVLGPGGRTIRLHPRS